MTSPQFIRGVSLESLNVQPIGSGSDVVLSKLLPSLYTYHYSPGGAISSRRLLIGGSPYSSIWASLPDAGSKGHPGVLLFHKDSDDYYTRRRIKSDDRGRRQRSQVLQAIDLYPFNIFSKCHGVCISRPGKPDISYGPFTLLCNFVRWILEHTTEATDQYANCGFQQGTVPTMSTRHLKNLEGVWAVLHGMFEQQCNDSPQELNHESHQDLIYDTRHTPNSTTAEGNQQPKEPEEPKEETNALSAPDSEENPGNSKQSDVRMSRGVCRSHWYWQDILEQV